MRWYLRIWLTLRLWWALFLQSFRMAHDGWRELGDVWLEPEDTLNYTITRTFDVPLYGKAEEVNNEEYPE